MLCPSVSVLGLRYLDVTPSDLRTIWQERLLSDAPPLRVFTPNATIAAAAHKDAALKTLLQQADLLLPDGQGVLLAAKLAGTPLRSRLPGIDAAEIAMQLCAQHHLPVYFLGAAPSVAQRAAAHWKQRLPALFVAGSHHGYFPTSENHAILADIRASGARVVLVCLGFPAQERWIVENAPHLPDVRLFMGLGGSFDVWAGVCRRAPRAVRAAKMEWLWRTVQKPSRFKTLLPAVSYLKAAKGSAKGKKPSKFNRFFRQTAYKFRKTPKVKKFHKSP